MIIINQTFCFLLAEKEGFEPSHRSHGLLAFQASPFSLLGISPARFIIAIKVSKVIYIIIVIFSAVYRNLLLIMVKLQCMKTFTIDYQTSDQRVDKFVRKVLNKAPESFIYKLFRIKDIKVAGKPVKRDYVLQVGDEVKIYVTDAQYEQFNALNEVEAMMFPYPIVYEDEQILIVNKPSGILVHGGNAGEVDTLTRAVLSYLKFSGSWNETAGVTPAPAHRLDKETSGLIVYGKTIGALQALTKMFASPGAVKKTYIALVSEQTLPNGKIEAPLLKNNATGQVEVVSTGKKALTTYQTRELFNECSLVEVYLHTGRTHQIRAHFASINHPLIGDRRYGNVDINEKFQKDYGIVNQLLSASEITIEKIDPPLAYLKGKSFHIEPSDELVKIIKILQKEGKRL